MSLSLWIISYVLPDFGHTYFCVFVEFVQQEANYLLSAPIEWTSYSRSNTFEFTQC